MSRQRLTIRMDVSFTPLPEERRAAWEAALGQFFAILVEGYQPKGCDQETGQLVISNQEAMEYAGD